MRGPGCVMSVVDAALTWSTAALMDSCFVTSKVSVLHPIALRLSMLSSLRADA